MNINRASCRASFVFLCLLISLAVQGQQAGPSISTGTFDASEYWTTPSDTYHRFHIGSDGSVSTMTPAGEAPPIAPGWGNVANRPMIWVWSDKGRTVESGPPVVDWKSFQPSPGRHSQGGSGSASNETPGDECTISKAEEIEARALRAVIIEMLPLAEDEEQFAANEPKECERKKLRYYKTVLAQL